MYASCIIDINHKNVDRSFTYEVPSEIENEVKPGVRVLVPFGKGDSVRQAFVLRTSERSDVPDGKVKAGEWIDVIRFRDWLENDMRVRVANVLLSNPKIPYTDSGIALIRTAMVSSLMQGQQNGGISETTIATDGTLIPGYAVSVPSAASISAADKAARVLNNCRFEAYLSGAIHAVKIIGYLSYLG